VRFWATYLFCLISLASWASNDTIAPNTNKSSKSVVFKRNENHSAKKAGMLSAIVPGLGQVYNRKYWKVPIVYGALGGVGYLAYTNTIYYRFWHDGLIIKNAITNKQKTNADFIAFAQNSKYRTKATTLSVEALSSKSEAEFQAENDYYRRNRDLSFFFMGILYLANILDATVDGHLYNFDVSDNLSFRLQPTYISSYSYNESPRLGLSLTAKF
jgi:hypothetical protein